VENDVRAPLMPTVMGMDVMATREWMDAGRTRAQLRTDLSKGRLLRLRRGVVIDAEPPDALSLHRLKIAAAARCLAEGTYFGHESAAVLHGLPLLTGRLGEVVAVRTGGGHGNITDTLHARRATLGPDDVTRVDGWPVTSLERTIADLTRRLPFPEAVMVADAGLRTGADLAMVGEYAAVGRGCRMARQVLDFASPLAESAGESLSRVRMQQAGLPLPELQHEFVSEAGTWLARLDFWWPWCRVAGEFDGMVKYGRLVQPGRTVEDVIRDEKRREQRLVDAGVRVIRWTWPDLWDGSLAVRLRRALVGPPSGPNAVHGAGPMAFALPAPSPRARLSAERSTLGSSPQR
jgi:hypothetical protein